MKARKLTPTQRAALVLLRDHGGRGSLGPLVDAYLSLPVTELVAFGLADEAHFPERRAWITAKGEAWLKSPKNRHEDDTP